MNIAIIDADIIGKSSHSFPNLACMKSSSFYKREGHSVILKPITKDWTHTRRTGHEYKTSRRTARENACGF